MNNRSKIKVIKLSKKFIESVNKNIYSNSDKRTDVGYVPNQKCHKLASRAHDNPNAARLTKDRGYRETPAFLRHQETSLSTRTLPGSGCRGFRLLRMYGSRGKFDRCQRRMFVFLTSSCTLFTVEIFVNNVAAKDHC